MISCRYTSKEVITLAVTFNDNSQEAKEKLKQNILRACEAVGLYVEGESKKLSPIDTGNLRGSIEHDSDAEQGIARIGTNVEYAIYQEFGTRFQKGMPFLRPAAENNVDRIKKIVGDYLKME